MINSPEIFFPILAAALYNVSVIFVKLSTEKNTLSPTSILFFNNALMWAIFLPSIFLKGGIKDPSLIWQPLLIGIFFAMGNLATFLCAHKGEVSLMTPIMGVKILLVLVLAKLLIGLALPPAIIASAIICCLAVFIMGYSKKAFASGKIGWTFLLAFWSCSSYAMCDVLIQKYSPNFSALSMLCISNFVLLLSALPFFPKFLRDLHSAGRRPLALGALAAVLMVAESLLMFMAISGDVGAPLCNILYNTRGILSVVLIFFLGKYFLGLRELSQGTALRRTIGSIMILFAIAIVFV